MIKLDKICNILHDNMKSAKVISVGLFEKPVKPVVALERVPEVDKLEKFVDYSIKDQSLLASLKMDSFGSSFQPVFYRIVDENELLKILSGKSVISNRASYKGLLTDITTNPFYSKIPRQGKYRLEFNNDKNVLANSGRIRAWAPENSHYQIIGPYDKNDIKSIAYFDGDEVLELGSVNSFLESLK